MPQILNEHNFSSATLKTLYTEVVVKPFNGNHNANDNDPDLLHFFNRRVRPYFQDIFSSYDGANDIEKGLAIIKELRSDILKQILICLEDRTNLLGIINSTIKANITRLIRTNKDELQAMQFNCRFCADFRVLINQLLGPIITNNINNKLNANHLLGAWRALDPQNNRRGGFSSYINNIFSYSSNGTLLVCDSDPLSYQASYAKAIIDIIAIYYLATKRACCGAVLAIQEQEHRFSMLTDTLTEALRGYNEGNTVGVDYPSCPGGIIGRLVEQGGYEQNIQFISRKTFINTVISDIVCRKVHEFLSQVTTTEEITNLIAALSNGFADNQQLRTLEGTPSLLQKRFSLFDANSNNALFFQFIIYEIKKEKDAHNDSVVVSLYDEIATYDYQSFVDAFTSLPNLYNPNGIIFFREELSKEAKLIGYAFSDPAYYCFPRILNMCLAKLNQLQPQSSQIISDQLANSICQEVIEIFSAKVAPYPLLASGFIHVDLTIVITSYKNGINGNESDLEFFKRIIQLSFHDRDELGNIEEISALGSIINERLINRSYLNKHIAKCILLKIKEQLMPHQLEALERQLLEIEGLEQFSSNVFPQGYALDQERSLGEIIMQNLKHVFARTGHDEDRIRYILGIRDTRFVGPYSNTLDLPNIPVIHPYFPTGIEHSQLYDIGIPSFPIVVAIPSGTIGNSPSGVTEQLIRYNININQLEVFFCVQNMPWQHREQLLLRPHPWLHKNAPFRGCYTQNGVILANVMAVNARLEELTIFDVNTHNNEEGEVVYSPNNMIILGMDDRSKSHSFYSFCIEQSSSKAVLTLHWLLNRQDYDHIVMLVNSAYAGNANLSLKEIIEWGDHIVSSNLNDGIVSPEEQVINITAVDALKSLVFGGQPEILVNNHQYKLMEYVRQLRPLSQNRSVGTTNVAATSNSTGQPQIPLASQPFAVRRAHRIG